jgi:hypothetical protein
MGAGARRCRLSGVECKVATVLHARKHVALRFRPEAELGWSGRVTDLQTRVGELTRGLITAEVRSAVVAVDWRGRGSAAAAAGVARQDTGALMRVQSQFHIASVRQCAV